MIKFPLYGIERVYTFESFIISLHAACLLCICKIDCDQLNIYSFVVFSRLLTGKSACNLQYSLESM